MIVNSTKEPNTFKPIKLTLTLENMKEVNTIYALFNNVLITDWLKKELNYDFGNEIRKSLMSSSEGDIRDDIPFQNLNRALKDSY